MVCSDQPGLDGMNGELVLAAGYRNTTASHCAVADREGVAAAPLESITWGNKLPSVHLDILRNRSVSVDLLI